MVILLCTSWEHFFSSMKKKVTDEKISTLRTVLGAPSMTVWTIASHRIACKVINIAHPTKRKNLFYSLVNNSSAESFSRFQLGKTSSHVENFKSQFRHSAFCWSSCKRCTSVQGQVLTNGRDKLTSCELVEQRSKRRTTVKKEEFCVDKYKKML